VEVTLRLDCQDIRGAGECPDLLRTGLPADLHESHASYVSHWLEILKADKTAIITAAAKADQAFNHLAAYSGYQSEPVEDEGEEADETAPVPACA
jgi:antirestriction protein ArdC